MEPPSPYDEFRDRKIALGECMTCSNPHMPGTPYCAECYNYDDHVETLRKAALMGLENQIAKLNKSQRCDMRELKQDLNRAAKFIRYYG